MKICVVGQGFVGGTMTEVLSEVHSVETYDKFNPEKSTVDSIAELCSKAEIIFVCVPTPMRKSGACDTRIVETVLEEISAANQNNIAVIRSTVPPGTTAAFNQKFENIEVMFNPEFLRESSPVEDFRTQTRIVLGGDLGKKLLTPKSKEGDKKDPLSKLAMMYRMAFTGIPILQTNHTTAEMIKYTTNVFLATKVSLANELSQVCKGVGVNYDEMIKLAQYDPRLGKSHWQVPGPDGHFGFGGSCFCKDINALMFEAKRREIDPKVMQAAWDKNLEVRSERDWEKLIGRAVTEDD
jgi:UDPglucose 6-dehydrogenase